MSKKYSKKSDLGKNLMLLIIFALLVIEIYLTVTMGIGGFIMGLILDAFIIFMIISVGSKKSSSKVNSFLEHKNNKDNK